MIDRWVFASLAWMVWGHLVREVLYKSLGKTLRSQYGMANLFVRKLIYKNHVFIWLISNCETWFFIPQQRSLCLAARFFTTQKIFPHCEKQGGAKKKPTWKRRLFIGCALNEAL